MQQKFRRIKKIRWRLFRKFIALMRVDFSLDVHVNQLASSATSASTILHEPEKTEDDDYNHDNANNINKDTREIRKTNPTGDASSSAFNSCVSVNTSFAFCMLHQPFFGLCIFPES